MFFHWALLLTVFPKEKSLSLRLQDGSLIYKKTGFLFWTFHIHCSGFILFSGSCRSRIQAGNLLYGGHILSTSVNYK